MDITHNDALTAGVRAGGLNSSTEIKILICYLLNSINAPITKQQLLESITSQELANYFELNDAFVKLVDLNLIIEDNENLVITDSGRDIAKELEKVLPISVVERAHKAAISILQFSTLEKQNKTTITKEDDGSYTLKCSIEDPDFTAFAMQITMPNEQTAKIAKEKFILHAQDIFKIILGITLDDKDMYKTVLNKLNEN